LQNDDRIWWRPSGSNSSSSNNNNSNSNTTDTACLDGLKVGSILWVIGAHVLAIQSSTGAGYLNPGNFLPPHGFTTTFFGQLLFSSRFAVDTFLCISGYLAAHVLQRKLQHKRNSNSNSNSGTTTTTTTTTTMMLQVPAVVVYRILRILPLYLCCLGFWMFLAPHLGHGPFWYQWEHFLEPCRQLWWTNLLFVNNFWPWGATTEANCFYHSWYLAVDVQLFCLFAPWLVLVYNHGSNSNGGNSNSNGGNSIGGNTNNYKRLAQNITLLLWLASVLGTAYLAYTQQWSVNTFDGISVALFDVEAYGKPHVRAQSYLAGIFVAFWPRRKKSRRRNNTTKNNTKNHNNTHNTFHDNAPMVLILCAMAVLCFVTVTGAYGRRACTFAESPLQGDDCGSTWSPATNFCYTAFSRAAWSVCIALLLHLCLDESDGTSDGNEYHHDDHDHHRHHPSMASVNVTGIVRSILSWSVWTPLARLSFGAYLIHPIVIYVWFLGGREKIIFRMSTYLMHFCSIAVVTFCLSFLVTILVEFPFGVLLRPPSGNGGSSGSSNTNTNASTNANRGAKTQTSGKRRPDRRQQQQRQRQHQQLQENPTTDTDTEMASLLLESSSSPSMSSSSSMSMSMSISASLSPPQSPLVASYGSIPSDRRRRQSS